MIAFRRRSLFRCFKWALPPLLVLLSGTTKAQLVGSESGTPFGNPPLHYRGPDPLAKQFLPANASIGGGPSLLPPHIPPSEFLGPEHGFLTRESHVPPASIESYLPAAEDPYLPGAALTDHKDGFFQKLKLTGAWIDRNDKADDFGLTEVDLLATFAAPLPTRDWPLLITPALKMRFLDGPRIVDVPERLYETYLELLWLPRFGERWTAILGAAPSIYSDFETEDGDAFRVTGTGILRYDWAPGQVQVLFGVLYLGREDVTILPAGGLIWTPDTGRRYELLFPKPKLAHRITSGGHFEDWIYLGGEFGGNSYAIERANTMADTITLRDFRAYLGLERKLGGGAGYRLEIGYVWGRVIEFASATPDVEADPTALIRGGVTF